MGKRKPRIGVIGPAVCTAATLEMAREIGRLIAEQGGILICGGRGGVMEAAAAGAKEAGGTTVGILPGSGDSEANPYIDIPISTGMGNARNVVNVLTSEVVIAVHGAYGTLSEIALALKCGVPVVGVDTWELRTPSGEPVPVARAATAEQAVAMAFATLGR